MPSVPDVKSGAATDPSTADVFTLSASVLMFSLLGFG